EEVDAPEQRRLARARGADERHDLVLGHLEVDAAEDLVAPERLRQPLDREPPPHAARAPACRRRRSRATSQSVKRASGIVIATNSVAATRYEVKLKVAFASICDCWNASTAPSVPTSAVSFCRPMKSFRSGGITRRTACGRITRRSVCQRVSPSERAAASWLGWIESIPAPQTAHTEPPE